MSANIEWTRIYWARSLGISWRLLLINLVRIWSLIFLCWEWFLLMIWKNGSSRSFLIGWHYSLLATLDGRQIAVLLDVSVTTSPGLLSLVGPISFSGISSTLFCGCLENVPPKCKLCFSFFDFFWGGLWGGNVRWIPIILEVWVIFEPYFGCQS